MKSSPALIKFCLIHRPQNFQTESFRPRFKNLSKNYQLAKLNCQNVKQINQRNLKVKRKFNINPWRIKKKCTLRQFQSVLKLKSKIMNKKTIKKSFFILKTKSLNQCNKKLNSLKSWRLPKDHLRIKKITFLTKKSC